MRSEKKQSTGQSLLLIIDVVMEGVPFGIVIKGKDGVKQGFSALYTAIPDFKVVPKSWITDGSSFALEVKLTGTPKGDLHCLPATGKGSFSVRACGFGEFENGKIKGRSDYFDSASLTKLLVGD
jgi:steroid delta-isomerase-like uncharacterized protein